MNRLAYLLVTLVLAGSGTAASVVGGSSAWAVTTGCGAAWAVQGLAFWFLAGALQARRPVARVWIAGMAGRAGAGVLVWLLAALAGAPTKELMVAYGLALVVFLLLEAGWLAVATAGGTARRT